MKEQEQLIFRNSISSLANNINNNVDMYCGHNKTNISILFEEQSNVHIEIDNLLSKYFN